MRTDIHTIAVIGAGTIGASWAAWFLARGKRVIASDPSPDAPALIRRMIANAWPGLTTLGLAPGADPTNWRFTQNPAEAAAEADFIQESAPERLPLKQALLAEIDAATAPDIVIASSTSGLLASSLAERCAHPERLVIGHPFNPPHLIPLVEVVGGQHTTPATIDAALAIYRSLGKHPIKLNKEVPGHLANRLQAALWREAVHMLAEGVASVADIDAAISQGPGLRWALMGPHLTFHLAGGEGGMEHFLHHLLPAMRGWWNDLGNPSVDDATQAALIQGVQDEAQGQPIPTLAAQRDAALLRLLAAREG